MDAINKEEKQINEEQMTEEQILETFNREKKQYEQSTLAERQELTDIYDVYQGKIDSVQNTPYDTKEVVPKLRTEVAYIKPFIFSGKPEIEVEGIGDEDRTLSMILEKIVNYRLSQSIPNSYDIIEDWVHQATTFGTSLIKIFWEFKTKKNEDGTETPVVDEPNLEVPNIMDVYFNPIISEVNSQISIICRSVLSLDVVKKNIAYNFKNSKGERNADKLEARGKFTSNPYDSSSQKSSEALSNQDGMIEVFERYTNDRIQTIACGKEDLVIRDVENPYGYINLVKFVFEKDTIPNNFSGKGVGHNTLGLGKSFYKLWNQLLTSVKLSNNPMFMFMKGARVDARQLVSKPGGGIEVTGEGPISNFIQPVQFNDVKQGAIEFLNRIDDEHKRASGANDLLQGTVSNNTLGQDQIAQSNISNRFELIQRRFKQALSEVAKMIIDMEIKNLQDVNAPILRIFPQELRQQVFLLIKNDAQNVKYNVKVKGDTIIAPNKALESKRLVDLFDLSQNFLTDTEKRAFLRRIAERQGENNMDELIGETNPIMVQQEQMMATGQQPQGEYNQLGAGVGEVQ